MYHKPFSAYNKNTIDHIDLVTDDSDLVTDDSEFVTDDSDLVLTTATL